MDLKHLRAYAHYPLVTLALRAYVPVPSLIGALLAFVLCFVLLLQMKGKLCFVRAPQLIIHSLSLFHLFYFTI